MQGSSTHDGEETLTMAHHHDLLRDLRSPTTELRTAIPETWAGFTSMHRAALGDGALPASTKEAIALALSVVERCDGCIAYHARGAAAAGATPEVVAEVLGVALLMAGGPAVVYGPRAWEAYHEFRGELGGRGATGS
jgi:AhpD family alkylhydroperoxidase